MAVSAEYLAYIQDLLCDLPDLCVKRFLEVNHYVHLIT